MRQKLLSTLIASMFVAAPALAADPAPFIAEGQVSVGPITTSTSDDGDQTKLREYRDLRNGVLSNVFVRGRGGNIWFDAYGENFGRDDQFMSLRGGMYGAFKYRLYSDSLPHEFLMNGRTPLNGPGTNAQFGNFPAPNPNVWNPVDIGYKRTDNGGYFEWQSLSPWYFRVDANEVKFDGSKIGSSSLGTSPGNGFIDLAFPVQYSTKNATGEAGYNLGRMNIAVSWLNSKFTNNNDILRWTNPYFANGIDTTYLPPDNEYNRLAVNGTWRSLPYNSTFAARYAWSKLTSDTDLATSALNGTNGAIGLTNPNVSTFNGKHEDQVLNLTLRSGPMTGVDTRIYYSFYSRDNKSTEVIYDPVAGLNCGGGECENELFEYRKHNFGLEGFWRFMPGNRLGIGYDYWNKDYTNRPDYSGDRENKIFLEWKNTQLENLSARLKYTYLERRSDFNYGNAGTNGSDPDYLLRFVSAFDLSDVNRNELKANVDWTAMPFLDFSFEGSYRENKYKNITFGRTNDKRYNLFGSASWGDFKSFRLTLFGDYEEIKYDAAHRYIGAVPCTTASGLFCNDPSQPPNVFAYNWNSNTKDKNWMVGLGADVPVNEQFLLQSSLLYMETNGSADFATQCGGVPGQNSTDCPGRNAPGSSTTTFAVVPFPIGNFDDSKRTSFNLKGIYNLNRNWAFTLGYAYERWRYDDVAHAGYTYTIPASSNQTSYLNGYMAYTNYTANIFYALASFKF